MAIYAAAFANQITVDLGDGLGNEPIVDEKEATRNVIRLIKEWTRKAGCSTQIVCLSSIQSDSFRHRLWEPYKAGRGEKPRAYLAVRHAVELEFETYQEPGLEADDLMGIAGTSERAQTVIVSRDKDMRTVPALVFNPEHDVRPVRIRPAIADQMWMKQAMIGDAIDNYPGIPKVGEVTAQKILTHPHRLYSVDAKKGKKTVKKWIEGQSCGLWQCMVDYATKAGKTEEDLITMAQVSRILRAGDFDKERRVVKLWRPNGHKELHL
jgi:DNA polymerase-1